MSKLVEESAQELVNINVGVLGHVDSGKTSLVKALSTSLSTASLDKSPQSQQRGITLDLGFSSFCLPMPEHLREVGENRTMQFTLVDCPGHASLIKTIIGGAQIIDMIVLVIDANKGIQTQTAECIVIGEITTKNLIIVLNKIDAIPLDEREAKLEKVMNRIRNTFRTTKFKDAPMVCTAAFPGGEKVAAIGTKDGIPLELNVRHEEKSIGIDSLVKIMCASVQLPQRDYKAPFYFAIDHCFQIKGHGTILTGTILSGSITTNQIVEIPYIQQQRKVKSMQMFRKNVKMAKQGDRVGMCVTNLDAESIERGIAAAPGSVPLLHSVICLVKKVRFFKGTCKSNAKYHVSIGHTTIVATATFFGAQELESDEPPPEKDNNAKIKSPENSQDGGFPSVTFDWSQQFETQDALVGAIDTSEDSQSSSLVYGNEVLQWASLRFQQPIFCPMGSLIIGSRLDTDTREDGNGAKMCRLAFYGPIIESIDPNETSNHSIDKIRIYSQKQKHAEVLKLTDVRSGGVCYELVASKLYGEGGSLSPFIGMKMKTKRGQLGTITAPFGSGGQFKVKFAHGIPRSNILPGSTLYLPFKRYADDKRKTMVQIGSDLDDSVRPTAEQADDLNFVVTPKPPAAVDTPKDIIHDVPKAVVTKLETSPEKSAAKVSIDLRNGIVDSLKDPLMIDGVSLYSVIIVSGAFQMEENIRVYIGSSVEGPSGQIGELVGPFAKMGKCKVKFAQGFRGTEGDQIKITIRK